MHHCPACAGVSNLTFSLQPSEEVFLWLKRA
jgi:hypothetical protein